MTLTWQHKLNTADSTWANKAEIRHIGWIIGFFIRVKNLDNKFSDHQRVWAVLKSWGRRVLQF